ncbi:hypothetical protein EYD10_07352 [Varanus komodoensis]|nr:hypothetical protein EYD10_07352 [Varanus komodoensis]
MIDKAGAPVDALVELWNGEMTGAIDTIAPKRPLLPGRARSSPWYTPELQAMKRVGRCLEHRWRKSRDESDQTHLRAHYQAYAVTVRAAKKKFFSVSIASSQCRPVELFRVVQGLVHLGPMKDPVPPSMAHCDNLAKHFKEKTAQIHHELDSTSDSEPSGEVPMLPSGPKLMDEFQLLWPDDVDKVLGQEVVVQPVLKKASLDPEMATNYRPVANIPFLSKELEWVVAGQLQALLDETDYLDPFQFGFRPGYGTESALVTLYDDLCWERDRGSVSLLVLLDLSAAFDTIDHVLRQFHWLPIEVQAQFKVLVITYKALNGLGPGYLKERLCPYLPSCPLRSAAEALLREPSVKNIRRNWVTILPEKVVAIPVERSFMEGMQVKKKSEKAQIGPGMAVSLPSALPKTRRE